MTKGKLIAKLETSLDTPRRAHSQGETAIMEQELDPGPG